MRSRIMGTAFILTVRASLVAMRHPSISEDFQAWASLYTGNPLQATEEWITLFDLGQAYVEVQGI